MNFYWSISRLALATVAATAVLVGCSSEGTSQDAAGEESIDEGALSTAGQSLVGEYASDDDTYASDLDLKSDGTFTASFNPRAVGVTLACVRAPCMAQGSGTWNVNANKRLVLKVKSLTGTTGTRSITFNQELKHGIIPMLTLERVVNSLGPQTFRGRGSAGAGCTAMLCAPNTQCIERSDGVATCVPLTPPPPVGSECTSDSDCRAVDDYCTGCDCRALAPGERLPVCTHPGVRCFAQPCATKTAACVNGSCTIQ